MGAIFTAAGIEGTLKGDWFSLSGGVGVGYGGSASAGLRDADQDGNPEVCVRVAGAAGGKVMLGACVELPARRED